MRFVYFLPLFVLIILPAYAYNSGFQPIYQPSLPPVGGNVIENYCIVGDFFNSYNSTTGVLTCVTPLGIGENNTASNLLPGTGLFDSKIGVDLRFKSLVNGTNITITNNSTSVIISGSASSGENTTATNLGTNGHGIFESEVSDQLRFKKITCTGLTCTNNSTSILLSVSGGSGNMTVLNDAGDVTITSPAVKSLLYFISGQWIDQLFSVNTISGSAGKLLYGMDNQTGFWTQAIIKNKLLDGSNHTDTTSQDPSRGSIIIGSQTSKWDELVIGSNGKVLTSNGTDPSWQTPSGSTTRENLVGHFELDRTWTNIGVSMVDVYGTAENVRIDTNGMTTATLQIQWTKIGVGTQKCQIVDVTTPTNILITYNNLASGLNTNATVAIPAGLANTIKTYKPQCLSSTSTDDPVWLSASVLLR